MAWDSSRPVPWERLMREWVIYAAIMGGIFVLFFRGGSLVGAIAGVLISGPLYLLFGAVLAKFGYHRKTLKELRASAAEPSSSTKSGSDSSERPRARPAPTSRTAGGGNRPSGKKRRR